MTIRPRLIGVAAALVLGLGASGHGRATPRMDVTTRCDDGPAISTRLFARPQHRLPLTIHYVGRRVPSLPRALKRAAYELDFHGLTVELWAFEFHDSPTGATRIQRRQALAERAVPDGSLHVFIVDRVDDYTVDHRGKARGWHWRYRGRRASLRDRELVLVTADAPSTTLAHEIGHALGLRHDTRPDNLMCHCRAGVETRFTHAQGVRMREGLRRFAARQAGRTLPWAGPAKRCGVQLRRARMEWR